VENVALPILQTPSTAGEPTAADGFIPLPFPPSYPSGVAEWVKFVPQAIYWGLRLLHERYGYDKLYITENGTVGADELVNGRIIDTDRVQYYRLYLQSALRAVAEGLPLRGFFAWSMMDNFEWSEGYHHRFGIIHVDFETLKRTPKLSAAFYRECIRARTVL
ncbi:MAG: family 1 glycosylhydrolase, partial [Planctomycetes bacterium]|nr:family 1 glycosylhydrolase [Planctomycetota bacterium]